MTRSVKPGVVVEVPSRSRVGHVVHVGWRWRKGPRQARRLAVTSSWCDGCVRTISCLQQISDQEFKRELGAIFGRFAIICHTLFFSDARLRTYVAMRNKLRLPL